MSSLYESFRNEECQSKSYEEESHKFDSILHEFYHYIIYENFCDIERVKSQAEEANRMENIVVRKIDFGKFLR